MGLENGGGEGGRLVRTLALLAFVGLFYLKKKNKVKNLCRIKKKMLANGKKKVVFLLFEVENYNNQKTNFFPEIF